MSSPLSGRVHRLVLGGHSISRPINAVFYYHTVAGSGTADDLAEAFFADVLPAILAATAQTTVYQSMEVTGVQGIFDIESRVFDSPGEIAVDGEPDFVAWQWRFNRIDAQDRHGFKRLSGVPDDYWVAGAPTATYNTELAAVTAALDAIINFSVPTYRLAIQRRQDNNVELDPPLYYDFLNVTFRGITTQSSRK